MLRYTKHPSDRDLILAMDDELPRPRQIRLRIHLAGCPTCQDRTRRLKESSARLVRAYEDSFDLMDVPTVHARARLRARLFEISQECERSRPLRFSRPSRGLSMWGLAAAAVVVGCVLVPVLQRAGRLSSDASTVLATQLGPLPDRSLTPGATRPVTLYEVCKGSSGPAQVVPGPVRDEVLRDYRMKGLSGEYFELDYLITPELGGVASRENLWPEPYATAVWSAPVKDELEHLLPQLICQGRVDLATAQHDIATDWIAAYKKYFHTDRPLRTSVTTPTSESNHEPYSGLEGQAVQRGKEKDDPLTQATLRRRRSPQT
jgi:hypothetical protein